MNIQDAINIEEIDGWKVEFTEAGTAEWYHPEFNFAIYATPNWNVDGEVPVQIYSFNDEKFIEFGNIVLSGDLKQQIEIYTGFVKLAIKSVDKSV